MNARDFLDLQDAYQGVYQEIDEVRGGGKIDPVSDMPGIGEKGARSPKDAGLLMSPRDRAEARAKALKQREDPEAKKNANRINSRFVKPTDRAVNRALLAATNARHAEKQRLMNSYEYDTFDAILEHLVAEGYADTNENALAIMANMSEEWREEILDEAVRGSGRSIGDRITGNDIRGVTRGNKSVYKKPKWKDEVENKVDRQFPSTRRTQTSNTYDGGRDSNTIKANKKSISRLNAAKNIEDKQADGDYENPIDHSKPYGKGKSGYMEVPTDYRARRRRASGR